MKKQKDYSQDAEELRSRMLLETFPIAIAMLESETDIPEGAVRPVRDLGGHMSLCQGFALSRREELTVAFLKQDHWCYVPVIAFGHAEPTPFLLDGHADYPERIMSREASIRVAQDRVHLEYGKYAGIVSAPLRSAPFEPDCVMIYCNSSQLRALLMGLRYKDGYTVTTTLEPGSACANGTIPVMRERKCQVTIPCMGDRQRALAKDHEIILTVPIERFEELLIGVRHFDAAGLIFPKTYMRLDHPMTDKYREVGRTLGLEM
jgi:uncharacterized protein (DUF169 family)